MWEWDSVTRFSTSGFFHESVFPKHLSIPVRPFRIFSKIRGDIRGSRCTTGVNDTCGKWKKSSSRKILIILFGHLWVVELTYIYIFAFKFTLRCLLPDIVLIICHRCRWHRWPICRRCRWYRWQFATGGKFATGVNSTRGNGGKICLWCRWYRWQICRRCRWYRRQFATGVIDTGGKFAPWLANNSANFRKNSKRSSWGWGETDS